MPTLDDLRAAVETERRTLFVPIDEVRTDHGGDTFTITGHAAVFDRLSEDLGGFRERIKRGAFRKVLDEGQDVRLLINHANWPVLGRTRSKTLELREDPKGLRVYADVAPTPEALSLKSALDRKDVDQMSFGFSMRGGRDEWHEDEDGEVVRTLIEVGGLLDVSVVTFPAYPQTDASARALPILRTQAPPEELAERSAEGGDTPDPQEPSATGEGDAGAPSSAAWRRAHTDRLAVTAPVPNPKQED